MKVGIVGFGFVGKALRYGLRDNVDCIEIDPKLKTNLNDLKNFNPDIIFICLPTPMKDDGSQNIDLIIEALEQINKFNFNPLVVLKSTVLPLYAKLLSEKNNNLVINPEFLRENSANEDFINSEIIIFGGEKQNCERLSDFYNNHTHCLCRDHVVTDCVSASLIKYTINSFLALKVVFFNEIKSVFDNVNPNNNWLNFINALTRDKRIGDSHMNVPGPDGRLGFGGPCFPKDVNAFIKYSQEIGSELNLLKKANIINNNIRAKYNDLTDREVEQNIKFDINKEE